jgi:hypothetical protein
MREKRPIYLLGIRRLSIANTCLPYETGPQGSAIFTILPSPSPSLGPSPTRPAILSKCVSSPIEIRSALPSCPASLSRDRPPGCILLSIAGRRIPPRVSPFGEKSVKRRRNESSLRRDRVRTTRGRPPMLDSVCQLRSFTREHFVKVACTRSYTRSACTVKAAFIARS